MIKLKKYLGKLLKLVFSTLLMICFSILLMICFSGEEAAGQNPDNEIITENFAKVDMSSLERIKASVDFQDVLLDDAIQRLGMKIGVTFNYNAKVIPKSAKVTYSYEGPISKILKDILPEDVSYTAVNDIVILQKQYSDIEWNESSQYLEMITGKVTDAKTGVTLPGVNIMVKGTTKGTSTNVEGRYEIDVASLQDTLIFSFIGYQRLEVPINGRSTINVSLQPQVVKGDELVVVGYGEQRKENLTGAIERIGGENLENRTNGNVTKSLQGLLPGVNIQVNDGDPSAIPDLNIRGFNSINGGSPLVLVDGVEGDLSRLNPSDIESITVLKDAASSAIYGGKGAFGVILVETKKGQRGDLSIDYSTEFGWVTPTARRDYIEDPYQYGKAVDAAIGGYNGSNYTGYDDMDWQAIEMVANGEIPPFHQEQSDGTNKFFYKTDWYNYLFKKWQPLETHSVSISGGSENITGYLSGRFLERSTIQNIVDANYTKYNLKGNLTFDVTDWLQVSGDVRYKTSQDIEYGGYRNGFGGIWSNTTWYYLFPFLPNEIDGTSFDYYAYGAHGALEDDGSNFDRVNNKNLVSTIRAEFSPLDNLNIKFDYTNKFNHFARSYRLNEFNILTGSRIERETVGINQLSEYRWQNFENIFNVFGTYSKSILSDHNFKLMLGYNQSDFERDRVMGRKNDLLYKDLSNLGLGTEVVTTDGSALVYATQGYFGRFNYDYKGRYLVEVNARYDGSSRFPKESRWGFFPSISGGWKVSEERFWEPMEDIISSLKFRASYGELGNQNVDVYSFVQVLGLGRTSWIRDGSEMIYAGTPAPLPGEVSWETTEVIDLGIDIGFFDDKLTARFDWYEKNTHGMYVPGEPLPAVFGASEPKENIASLRNRGFEFSLSYQDEFHVGGSPLNIKTTANVSDFNAIITKYRNPDGIMSTFWEGQKLGQIWGYHVDGQFQSDTEAANYQNRFDNPSNSLGDVYNYILNVVQNSDWNRLRAGDIKYVDVNGDGEISNGQYTLEDHGDLRPIGNALPQFPFGFSINAKWKNFDFSVAGAGVAKQHWYPNGDIYWGTYERPYLSFLRKDLYQNAWSPDNPDNRYPQIQRGYSALASNRSLGATNDYYLTNVGYVRVKNLTLGYTLPVELTQKVNVQRLRIYVSGENLFTWRFGNLTKYLDPEIAGSGVNYSNPNYAVGNSEAQKYPMGKTYSIGASITF